MADRSAAPAPRLVAVRAAVRRDLLRPLRAVLPWAVLAALAAGVLGTAGAAVVALGQPEVHAARATFTLVTRPGDILPLSSSRSLLAEQTARFLRTGRADAIARDAAGGADYDAGWVPGPGYGQLSYQVTSTDPEVATRVAQAVFDQAGFLGTALVDDPDRAPTLDLDAVSPAAPTGQRPAVVLGAGGALGAVAGFFLTLLAAVRPRPAASRPAVSSPRPATSTPRP